MIGIKDRISDDLPSLAPAKLFFVDKNTHSSGMAKVAKIGDDFEYRARQRTSFN